MKIKNYLSFINESILYVSDNFKSIISEIKDDKIASSIISFIDNDVKTNFNILSTTDRHDIISFIPDAQSKSKLSNTPLNDLFKIKSNSTTIGRIARSILSDNKISYTDHEMEKFVNKFKSAYDIIMFKDKIKIVKGELIRYWYKSENYSNNTNGVSGRLGSLGKSCMRYEEAQDFLNIYVDNREVCSMVIKLDNENKLEARALLWKTNEGIYLDRVYYTYDSDENLLLSWVKKHFNDDKIKDFNDLGKIEVQLSKSEYADYPYMDSFPYLWKKENKLFSYDPRGRTNSIKDIIVLQETDGGNVPLDLVYCEIEDESYPDEDVVWSDYHNSYMHIDNAVFSKLMNSHIYRPDAVKSTIADDYLLMDNAILVYKDDEMRKFDYYPINDTSNKYSDTYAKDEFSSDYFIKDLLIEIDGKFYLKSQISLVYKIEKESMDDYISIYSCNWGYCTELDIKIFNFKINTEEKIVVSKNTLYYNLYINCIYKKIHKLVEDLEINKNDKKEKLEEIENANKKMRSHIFYKNNNYLYENFKTIENVVKWWKDFSKNNFEYAYEKTLISWGRSFPNDGEFKECIEFLYRNPEIFYKGGEELNKILLKYKLSSKLFLVDKLLQSLMSQCISTSDSSNLSFCYYFFRNIDKFKHIDN